jgi:hypothetical protein
MGCGQQHRGHRVFPSKSIGSGRPVLMPLRIVTRHER